MILFRVFLLVLVISLAYSMPADSKNEKGETADKGQGDDGKDEEEKETNHKVFLKEYGDKDKKFKEKGYNRKSEDEGDDGYKHFDSYHKKHSDKYGYESHSAYGKLKKGDEHGGDADIKYDDKDSHETAASRRVLHISSPWHDTEFLPHFDIERIASKFHKHSPSDHEYIHDHHPGYFDHHNIHYDSEHSHYKNDDHEHGHPHDHGYDHHPHEYDHPPPDHKDDHHPHEYDHPPPDHKHDHPLHEYDHPPQHKDDDSEYDYPPGHHEHDHHDEYDHIPKTDGHEYDHPPDHHKDEHGYDHHISVVTSSGDIDQSYDQKNSQHDDKSHLEYDHPPPGYGGHEDHPLDDESSDGFDQKDTYQYDGSHLEYDNPPLGYNGHDQNRSPNNEYDQAPNNKDQGEYDRPPPGYDYGNPTLRNNGGSDAISGNTHERKDTEAPKHYLENKDFINENQRPFDNNFPTAGLTGINQKKVLEGKPNYNHKYLNNIRIYFGGTYTPYLNGEKLDSWNNNSDENVKIDGVSFGGPISSAENVPETINNPESIGTPSGVLYDANNQHYSPENKEINTEKGHTPRINETNDTSCSDGNIGIVCDNSYDSHNNVPDHSIPGNENIPSDDGRIEAVTYGSPNNNNSEQEVITSDQQNSGIYIGNSYMPEDQKSDQDIYVNNGEVHDTSLENNKDMSQKDVDIQSDGSLNVNSQNYNYDVHEDNYSQKTKKIGHRIDDDSFSGLVMPISEKTQAHLNHNQQTNYDNSYSIVNQKSQHSPDAEINGSQRNSKTDISGSSNHGDQVANLPADQLNVQIQSQEDKGSFEMKQEHAPFQYSNTKEENQGPHFSSAPNTDDKKDQHSELTAGDTQKVYNNNESDRDNQQNVNDNEKALHNIALKPMHKDVHIPNTKGNGNVPNTGIYFTDPVELKNQNHKDFAIDSNGNKPDNFQGHNKHFFFTGTFNPTAQENNRDSDSNDDILQKNNYHKQEDDTHLGTKFTLFIPDERTGQETFNYNNEPPYAAPFNPTNQQIPNTPINTNAYQRNTDINLPGFTSSDNHTGGNPSNHETLGQFVPNMNMGVSDQDQQHLGYQYSEPKQATNELYSGPAFNSINNKSNYGKRNSDQRARNGRETFAYMSNPADQKMSIKRDNKDIRKQHPSANLGATPKRNSNQAKRGIYFSGTFNPELGNKNGYLRQGNYRDESLKNIDQKETHSKNKNSAGLNPHGIYFSRLFNSNYQKNNSNIYAHNIYPEELRNDGILPSEAYNYINHSYYGNSQPISNVKGDSETVKRTGEGRKNLADNRSSDISANRRKTIR